MTVFSVYNTGGEIVSVYSGISHDNILLGINKDENIYEGNTNPKTQYVEPATGTLKNKNDVTEEMSIGLGTVTISNLPNVCVVTVLGNSETIENGHIEIEFDEPGTYQITLECEPRYYSKTIEVVIP